MSGDSKAHEIDCADAVQRLWDYLDGELTEERLARVEEHLGHCKGCFRTLEIQREILRRVGDTTCCEDESLRALRRSILETIRKNTPDT